MSVEEEKADIERRERRARVLRILHDVVWDEFRAIVTFEQHYSAPLNVISSFFVSHAEKKVRSAAKVFVNDALGYLDVPVAWEGRDVFTVKLRPEPATAKEKLAMLMFLGDRK